MQGMNAERSRMAKSIDKFDPSTKLLTRVLKILLKRCTMGKTVLAQKANVNYARLVKHLNWLEQKGFVKFVVENGKVNIVLTKNGKEFAATFNSI